jgi:hypothetical protein
LSSRRGEERRGEERREEERRGEERTEERLILHRSAVSAAAGEARPRRRLGQWRRVLVLGI